MLEMHSKWGYNTTRITAENLAGVFRDDGVASLRIIEINGRIAVRFFMAIFPVFGGAGLPGNFAINQTRHSGNTVRVVIQEIGGQQRQATVVFTVVGGGIIVHC